MSIHVLHVIPSLARGGAERQLVSLVSGTSREEFKHTVCFLRPPDAFAAEIRRAGHAVVGLNVPGKMPWARAAAKLVPVLRSVRPDIVHTWLYDATISARLALLAVRPLALVTSLQNPDYDPETIRAANLSPIKVDILRALDRLTTVWSRPTFVACSGLVKCSANRRLGIPMSRISVIYNCGDSDSLHCSADEPRLLRQTLGIPADGIVFLNVGRLDPQKGQRILIEAFQRMLVRAPRAYLAIAGAGPLAGQLQELAERLNVQERVRFLGVRQDIGACLEMADVFVFPSLFEGFGIALVEAMLKGVPCIASRMEPFTELVTDGRTGLLVAPGCAEELSEAMADLYNDASLRSRLAAAAEKDASERFEIRKIAPQWESLYWHLCEGRRSAEVGCR